MAMATALDPRYKMKLIEFCFPKIYNVAESENHINQIRYSLYELYDDYVVAHASSNIGTSDSQVGRRSSNSPITSCNTKGKTKSWSKFDIWAQELETIEPSKSDLDIYLEESLYICRGNLDDDFDALDWWKANTLKFRILSNMASDLLSIPISTIASESTYSARGRVLDQYRSSLKPETVQAIICARDWLHSNFEVNKPLEVEAKKVVPRYDQSTMSRCNSSIQGSLGPGRTRKIFIGGLASTVTESDFRMYFE